MVLPATIDDSLARLPEPATLLAAMGEPLDPSRYDWSGARPGALRDEEIFQLTYATQVEWGTEGTFASLDISRDPVVRRFLRIWLDQEVVHAGLLARLLEGCGESVAPVHRERRHRRGAARGKLLNQLARLGIGDDFFAVHMSWGAINELTTLRFYSVMRENTTSELLRSLLRDVMAQEALHYSFYRNVAVRRLADNPRGQRIVRWVLEHLWTPVGTGLRTRPDVDRLMLGLFADRPAQVVQMDSQINRIPGLAGLDLVRRTIGSARDNLSDGRDA
jgi:rubrerythrin